MVVFTLFFVLGVCLLQQQADLPDWCWANMLWVFPLVLLLPIRWRVLRYGLIAMCALGMGFYHAAWQSEQRLQVSLPSEWQGQDIEVIGVVAELPRQHERGQRFKFDVEQTLTQGVTVPSRIYLGSYFGKQAKPILAGERWQFTVRLKQPHGTQNPYGFDFEYWALESNVRAVGYIHPKGKRQLLAPLAEGWSYQVEAWREQIRYKIQDTLRGTEYANVLVALTVGDQSSIPQSQWQVFTRTGVNHLMSISGLHITMLSSMMFALSYWGWRRSVWLTLRLPARKAAAMVALLTAFCYAMLAGFAVPAQRTVYMVGAVAVALWLNRRFSLLQILSIALLGVLLLDSWAVLSAGFWLSFAAVTLILYVTAHRLGENVQQQILSFSWSRRVVSEYCHVQWALTIGLIPLLLALFQQVSLISPVANAFAVPLISLLVVPLALLGAVVPSEVPLWLSHIVLDGTMQLLLYLNQLPQAVWIQHAPPTWAIVAGCLGVLVMLLPSGFPVRWAGGLMMLPMFINSQILPAENSLRMVIFDVGQGLSVMVQTAKHVLLYDAGPDLSGDADSGNRIIVPNLRAFGVSQIDSMMLSHNDADHTGGAASILHEIPTTLLHSSLPDDSDLLIETEDLERCLAGQTWQWEGVSFEVLSPTPDLYQREQKKKNNLSCVLQIRVGQQQILLTGDIEKKIEAELIERYGDALHTTVLIAPHHGSKTSSTLDFIEHTLPDYVVFTVGYRNQFGHPKAEVLARYEDSGANILRTDVSGAITLEMDGKSVQIQRQRAVKTRYWMN